MNITTFETLDSGIRKFDGKPIVLEALWDGDTRGWILLLYVYMETSASISRHLVGHLAVDNKFKQSTLWPQAPLAKELGEKAAAKYQLEFYFPSEEPDDHCPKWTEKHLAIKCADCNKLIIPTSSIHLPKSICYHCTLKRERNQKLINNEPVQDGVVLYLSNGFTTKKLGFWGDYSYLVLSNFNILALENLDKIKTIKVFSLKEKQIEKLKTDIECALEVEINNYSKPQIDEAFKRFLKSTQEVEYQGKTYLLDTRRNKGQYMILEYIKFLEYLNEALNESFDLKICFVRGLCYREDSILRFVHYLKNGTTRIKELEEQYKEILSKSQVIDAVERLVQNGCLTLSNLFEVRTTELGKNIV